MSYNNNNLLSAYTEYMYFPNIARISGEIYNYAYIQNQSQLNSHACVPLIYLSIRILSVMCV